MRRIRRRIEASLRNADAAVDTMDASVKQITDAVLDVLEEGVSFRLEIAGKAIPVKLIMEPDDGSVTNAEEAS